MKVVGRSGFFGLMAVTAAWLSSAASAAGPVETLVQAVQHSNQAKSVDVSLIEQVKIGARTLTTLRISGLDEPLTGSGSFLYVSSPAQSGMGRATMVVRGANVYVHYALFDTLRQRNPAIKHWLLVNTRSSLGVDPSGLVSLSVKEVRQLTGLTVAGTGSEGGVPVTRYRGTLALAKIAQTKQIQNLLALLPSEASTILRGTEKLETSVGEDQFVHRVKAVITAPLSDGTRLSITIDVSFANFNRTQHTIAAPPASEVMTVSQFQRATGSGPGAAADDALLQKLVLTAAQVRPGYKLSVIPGGKLVQGETTLDFCDQKYPSETLRTARLQAVYTAKGSNFEASNEVVTYQAGGAKQALLEVKHASTNCPDGRVPNAPKGVTNLVRHTQLISDPHLLPGAIAILQTESATVKGKRLTHQTIAVYQVRGNVLSGVYGYGNTLAAVEKLTLHAAEQSAANLLENVAATPVA